jgi:hypothetical protein
MDLDAIGQSRLDAKEVGEINAELLVEREIEAPGRELADYRHRLNKKRRQLIRSAMSDLIARFDETLEQINTTIPKDAEVNQRLDDNSGWDGLRNCVQAIDTLLGSSLSVPRVGLISGAISISRWFRISETSFVLIGHP